MLKKKIGIYALLLAMAAVGLAGCGSAAGASPADKASPAGGGDGKAFSVVCTIFPEYDWVMNVLGENPANAEVTMLLDNGVDLHSFQPTGKHVLR